MSDPSELVMQLYRAIRAGDTTGAAAALDAGADINTDLTRLPYVAEPGWEGLCFVRPLAAAVEQGDTSMARLLIERGATIEAPAAVEVTLSSVTPKATLVHVVAENAHTARFRAGSLDDMLALLISAGVDPARENWFNVTPLNAVVYNGAGPEIIEAFLRHKAAPADHDRLVMLRTLAARVHNAHALDALLRLSGPAMPSKAPHLALVAASQNGPTGVDSYGRSRRELGATPDGPALLRGFADVMAVIERHFGTDPDPGGHALVAAVSRGSSALTGYLIERAAARGVAARRATDAFVPACTSWRHVQLRQLLDAGADPLIENPAHMAASGEGTGDVADLAATLALLRSAGVDINAHDEKGAPVHYAVWHRGHERLAVLAGAGADLSARNRQGHTLLMRAVACANDSALRWLLERGADPHVRVNGVQAIHFADQRLRVSDVAGSPAERGAIECVRLLAAAGVAVDAPDDQGNTALLRAVGSGSSALVSELMAHGADPLAECGGGRTPLAAAEEKATTEAGLRVLELLRAGAARRMMASGGVNPGACL